MKSIYKTLAITLLSGSLIAGCSSDDDDGGFDTGTGDTVDTGDAVDTDDTADTGDTTDTDDQAFAFNTEDFSTFTRVDRVGMPAIATALIASDDAYNAADPNNDIAGDFVPEILASVEFLHAALDDQLIGLGLTPCTVVGDGTGTCATAAVPLIIPDTIKLDTAVAAGFPNGRLLTDPVIGVTLAVALLELTGEPAPHTALDLVGALNPAANDLEFSDEFPFLADPHQ